ncbi:MAG: ROK family protein [Clostridia bacterium]
MHNQSNEPVLGIDIGGTKVFIGLVSSGGQILHSYKYPMQRGKPDVLFNDLTVGIDRVLKEAKQQPKAIGIGLKGHVDAEHNQILSSSLIQMDAPYDLCAELTRRYGLPAAIDNDVNAATLAEAAIGAGRTANHFVYVNIGTGSAIGVYENGTLMRGRNNNYGEIGYTLCRRTNGEDGLFFLEDVASGRGLDHEIRRLGAQYTHSVLQNAMMNQTTLVSAVEIFEAYRNGDELAICAVEHALEVLALSILNFECLLNCGLYIFGGGIVKDPWFFGMLQNTVQKLCKLTKLQFTVQMRMSDLGAENVGLLGAASIALSVLEK